MGLPREIIRWLQTLKLPFAVKNARRDLSNGYLVAEICARYWSNVDLHQFDNGTSTKCKEGNWQVLRKVMSKNGAQIPEELIRDVINCVDGAGQNLLEALYTLLTHRVIHVAPPLQAETTIDEIPKIQKITNTSTVDVHLLQQQQRELQMKEAQAQEDELSRQREAEKQQQLQQQSKRRVEAKKPRPPQKTQTIRVADEAEESAAGPGVQFSQVTVKALNAQALARLGIASESRSSQRSKPQARENNRGSTAERTVSDNVVQNLSASLEGFLNDSGVVPSWTVAPGSSYVEHFAQNHSRMASGLREAVWKHLNSVSGDCASWILGSPAEIGTFAALFVPTVSTATVQTMLGRAHYPFAGEDADNSLEFAKEVFQRIAHRNPSYALQGLQRHIMPLLYDSFVLGATSQHSRVACIGAVAPLALVDFKSSSVSEARMIQMMAILYESLTGSTGPCAQALQAASAVGPVDELLFDDVAKRVAFLMALDALCQSISAELRALPDPINHSHRDDQSSHSASPPESSMAGYTSTDHEDGGAPAGPRPDALPQAFAAGVNYHVTNACHHPSSTVRLAALRLLTTLAKSGHSKLVALRHTELLAPLTPGAPVAFQIGQHAQTKLETIHLLSALLQHLTPNDASGDGDDGGVNADVVAVRGTLQKIALAIAMQTDDGSQTFFDRCSVVERVAIVTGLSASLDTFRAWSELLSEAEQDPTATLSRHLVQGLLTFPTALQAQLTTTLSDELPSRRSLRETWGIDEGKAIPPSTVVSGGADTWAILPLVSVLADHIAQAPLPAPQRSGTSGALKAPALPSEGGVTTQHLLRLVFRLVGRRERPIANSETVPMWWTVMTKLSDELRRTTSYLDAGRRTKSAIAPRKKANEEAAHSEYISLARQAKAIVLKFYAELSGIGTAPTAVEHSIVHFCESVDAPSSASGEENADVLEPFDDGEMKAMDWWNNVVPSEAKTGT